MAVCLISFDLLWFKRVRGAYSATAITFLLDIALPGGVATDYGCFFVFVDADISVSTAVVCGIAITVIVNAGAGRCAIHRSKINDEWVKR